MNAIRDERMACLCEIAELAWDRASTNDMTAQEAFFLGQIIGTAARIPGVLTHLKDREREQEARANGGFSRSWPPGVHGDVLGKPTKGDD